jgi:hypothetical protein
MLVSLLPSTRASTLKTSALLMTPASSSLAGDGRERVALDDLDAHRTLRLLGAARDGRGVDKVDRRHDAGQQEQAEDGRSDGGAALPAALLVPGRLQRVEPGL